jgi:hypothetical protein
LNRKIKDYAKIAVLRLCLYSYHGNALELLKYVYVWLIWGVLKSLVGIAKNETRTAMDSFRLSRLHELMEFNKLPKDYFLFSSTKRNLKRRRKRYANVPLLRENYAPSSLL